MTNRLTIAKPFTAYEVENLIRQWTGELRENFTSYPLAKQLLAAMQREAKLTTALVEALDFIRNRHNMGRGVREERRLEVLANGKAILYPNEYPAIDRKDVP